ncbi:MYOZ3 protein, partial [Nycticryphes semicollaris]|nr:MYOZ3 protein [Nycticryphes semicollaris]
SVPQLDLGKKMSTPQDLMIEELSLGNNRGSQLFHQRQKRMQRFVYEHPSSYREVGLLLIPRLRGGQPFPGSCKEAIPGGNGGEDAGGQQSYHSELHVAASPQGGPPQVPKKTEKVLQMSKILNPDALAPGYSGPLKEVPPEKFNVTAIPKGYRSPWQALLGDKDNTVLGKNQLPVRPSPWDFRSFNRTPAPFDKTLVSDLFSVPATELDNLSALEVISYRPNFNRTPQGWVRILPESDEL